MKPARVAFAWPELPHYGARLLRAGMRELGVPAEVVSTRSQLPLTGLEAILGQEIRWVPAADAACSWSALGAPVPEVLVVGGWSTPAFRNLVRQARAAGARVVLLMDNPWKGTVRQRLGACWFRARRGRMYDAIWVPGEGGAQFASKLGFAPERIWKGLYAADPEVFRGAAPLRDRGRHFVFIGQLIERKGLRVLAEALRLFTDQERPAIDLFGTGPLQSELAAVPGIRLGGFLPSESIARELGASRFLVLPSLEDHWPLVVHEAACSGCGIITTDGVGSRTELVSPKNGWIYPRGSAAHLAGCLREAVAADAAGLDTIEKESLRLSAAYSPALWGKRLREIIQGLRVDLPAAPAGMSH